jgi:histone H3/H4
MEKLPKASVNRILRNAGVERVSEGAYLELVRLLEEHGEEKTINVIRIAKHARGKSVEKKDILRGMAATSIGHKKGVAGPSPIGPRGKKKK